ncbi:hypothetical protein HDU67_002254, partial [Dinochytrium kinnereticum]
MSAFRPGTSSDSQDIPKDLEINNTDPDARSSSRNEENNKEKRPEAAYLDILGTAISDLAVAYQNAAVPITHTRLSSKAPPNPPWKSKKEDGENLKTAFHRTAEIDKSPIETVANLELNTPTRTSRTKTPPVGPRFPIPSSLGRPLQIDTRFDVGKPVVPYFDGISPYPMVDLLRSNASPVRFEIPDLSSAPMRGKPIFIESSSELAVTSPEHQASSYDSESRSQVTSSLSPPTTTEDPGRTPTHKTTVLYDGYEEIKAQVIPNEPPDMAPKKESLSSAMDGFKVPTSSTLTGFTSVSSSDIRKRVIKRVEELVFTNAGDEQDALIFLAKYRNILEQGLSTSTYSANAAFVDMDDAFNATKNAEKMFQGSAKWFAGSCTNADNWEQFVKEFRNAFAEKITDAKIGKDVASFKWNFDAADAPKKSWARLRDMNSVLPKSKRIKEEDLRRSFILSCTDLDWSNTAQNETFDGKTWEDYDLDMSDLLRGMASKVRFHPGSDHSSLNQTIKALERKVESLQADIKRTTPGMQPTRKPLINYAFTSFEESLPALIKDRNFMDRFVRAVTDYAREDYKGLDPDFEPPTMPEVLAFEAKMNDFRRDPDQFRRNMAKPDSSTNFKGGWISRSREASVEPQRSFAAPAAPTAASTSQERLSLQLAPGQKESMFLCPLHRDHALDVCPNHKQAYTLFSGKDSNPQGPTNDIHRNEWNSTQIDVIEASTQEPVATATENLEPPSKERNYV